MDTHDNGSGSCVTALRIKLIKITHFYIFRNHLVNSRAFRIAKFGKFLLCFIFHFVQFEVGTTSIKKGLFTFYFLDFRLVQIQIPLKRLIELESTFLGISSHYTGLNL